MREKTTGKRTYLAIDLKSFYASVECAERGLDPLGVNLVVADIRRTEKTICLAVSPSLKAYGIPGRARLFEVVQKVKEINAARRAAIPDHTFKGKSVDARELAEHPDWEVDYIVARPQMAHYMKRSTDIYQIYLRYVAPEDMHVYSVDEVFIDATEYLGTYRLTGKEFARKLMHEVLSETGITATAGVGPNLYLCKVAMDVQAKHIEPDERGARIAELDELSYRELFWEHRPITDFWRVGRGYEKKLASVGLYTMGDIARCSIGKPQDFYNEDLLFRLFGINAELLIDHAWGEEPCTMAEIKAYRPESNSLGSGQVLTCPYPADKARLVVREMMDLLSLELVEKRLVTDQIVLTVGYDIESLAGGGSQYRGEVTTDRYGRRVPKSAHGTENLEGMTSSTRKLMEAVERLYDRIVDPKLLVRRMFLTANHVIREADIPEKPVYEQLDLFTDYSEKEQREKREKEDLEKERRLQEAMLGIRKKFGKNAILKGMNLEEGATARERNEMIGGHKA